ncbi:hypothetical protein F4803DRAFT_559098 [Xylaria telfairii]|nr:hypothetical protein F4803DRAFT_559098 [Xylaria telfairii]
MAETTSPPPATPKRKRDDLVADMRVSASPTRHIAKTVFSFRPPSLQPAIPSHDRIEDGSSSPRSRIARKFGDLAIEESSEGPEAARLGSEPESGGGVTVARTLCRIGHQSVIPPDTAIFDFDAGTTTPREDMELDRDDDDTTAARKRTKTIEADTSLPVPAANDLERGAGNPTTQTISTDGRTNDRPSIFVDPIIKDTIEASQSGDLRKSYPSINRLADTKSRIRKRVGTPPLSSRRRGAAHTHAVKRENEEEDVVIVDPVRAALTWREDEITVYDPEDKDDDGTGINGIGFKPTAAVAYQRSQKRRQQLADYKKREESEARAKRSQRRREQLGGGAELARQHSIVRVHFSDAPPTTVMTT